MLMPSNENFVRLTGNISNMDIKNGQNGPFGSISLAIDDSYTKPGRNGQQPERIERTHFVTCDVSDSFFKKISNPEKGSRITVEGKLILDKWKDRTSGQDRSALKVKVIRVIAYIAKAERDQAKQMGWYGNANQQQNSNQQQGGFNQPQQGGYQQQQGGFNQPQQGGYQQQQGGFYQPQHGGYQQQQ